MSGGCAVSVIVPTYEGADRIAATLGQLRRQSFRDFEVVVVDDGSSDGTAAAVRACMRDDPRVRLVEQRNRGTAAARNRGVATARGRLIAFLDDDDLWLSRKLELQLARLEAAPQAALVSCYSALVDPQRRLLGWRFGGPTEGDVHREMLEWDMVSGGSVALVRRDRFEAVGGFDESLRWRADWDLWIRLAARHPFAFVPRTLVGYTRRDGGASQAYEDMVDEGRLVLARAARGDATLDLAPLHARDLFASACLCLVDEAPATAWRFLGRALRTGPRLILARPRRWGVIAMLMAASVLPRALYRRALGAMGRGAFGLERGEPFESLDPR